MNLSRPITLVHLYPSEMNIYGDTGNRIVLEKRLAWRSIPYRTVMVHIGDEIPADSDIILGGGGQDASQGRVAEDLQGKKEQLDTLVSAGCVMLMVCGMYQLFGERFVTHDGGVIKGIGVLPLETIGKPGRLIGTTTISTTELPLIVGYENHSGRTYLKDQSKRFAHVVSGKGNNDDSGEEGCRVNNVFGTYLHGPILSKNPDFADLLISLALKNNGVSEELPRLDDSLEFQAREIAVTRPR